MTRNLKSVVLLVIIGIICYSNTFEAPFHFDDQIRIVENEDIKDITNIKKIWSSYPPRFISNLSLALNYHFNGKNVFGYHFLNLVTHILCGLSVYWFCLLALETPRLKSISFFRTKYSTWFPILATLLFLSHPIQTQSVTYIVQRMAAITGLFYMLSMALYLKWTILQNDHQKKHGKALVYYALSLVTAVIAMFSKENAFTLPMAILMIEIIFFNTLIGETKKKLLFLSPFLLTFLIIPVTLLTSSDSTYHTLNVPRGDYFLTQFNVILTYLRLLFFPINLNLDYEYLIAKNIFSFPIFLSFLVLGLIVVLAINLLKKNPLISFGILFFFLTLSIESSIIPLRDLINEHRLYLPSIGFCIVISSAALQTTFSLLKTPPPKMRTIIFSKFIFGLLVFLFITGTYQRNKVWKTELSLWKDITKKSPKKVRGRYNLATLYLEQGSLKLAEKEFKATLAIAPNHLDTLNNLGALYKINGRWGEAEKKFKKSLEIKPNGNAHNNLGVIYLSMGKLDKAMIEFEIALKLFPGLAEAYSNLGDIYVKKNMLSESIAHYKKALRINSYLSETRFKLVLLLQRTNQLEKAIEELNKILVINPGHPEAQKTLHEITRNK
jgi:tetratricopeptide (TPR) repeat protein